MSKCEFFILRMPTFDVVILGATGFTGQWVVNYFNTVGPVFF